MGAHTVPQLLPRWKRRGLADLLMLTAVLVAFTACGRGSTVSEAEMAASRIYAGPKAWSDKMSAFLDRANAAIGESNLPGWPEIREGHSRLVLARAVRRRTGGA